MASLVLKVMSVEWLLFVYIEVISVILYKQQIESYWALAC